MEYTIIANTTDGRQLVAHGYRTIESSLTCMSERVVHAVCSTSWSHHATHYSGFVIIASSGMVLEFTGGGKCVTRQGATLIQKLLVAEKYGPTVAA